MYIILCPDAVGMWLPQLLGILLSAAIIQVGALIISVNSTLPSDHQVCPGEEVSFTCVVQGEILSWSSEEYMGSDGEQLEFGTINKPNETSNYSNTVATLLSIHKSERDGVTIESRLEIIASAKYSTSSVTCNDVSANASQSVHFIVPGEYLTI